LEQTPGTWMQAIRDLLKSGASVNGKQPDGMTALHWATFRDRADLVRLLLDSGADVNAVTEYDVRPLSLACENGNAEIVRLLVQKHADLEASLAGGETPLMLAARTGKPDVVRILLDAGASVNARERRQQTAVMWAAAEGHTEVVLQLVDAGADYQTPLLSGWTPLFFAVREGRTGAALTLLRKGLDVDAPLSGEQRQRGPNPLLLAVQNGHFETAAALLQHGANPNAQPMGQAALHAIVSVRRPVRGDGDPPPVGSGTLGSLDFVRQWAGHGGDVNLRLEKGRSGFADFTTTGATAFVLAAQSGDLPLLKLLLELGADPSIPNADGASAILAAAGVGDLGSGLEAAGTEQEAIEVIRVLLELGLDVNVVDENGETAVHGAAYQNWPELIRFLVAHGARVDVWNQPNRWGWTPLIIAHGYREGNFRPDAATIACLEEIMRAANVSVPEDPGRDVEANQQSWDRKPPKAGRNSIK
ncbi:MAG: ankyrin repeat domain-containing protein, partial [Planctomycetaceae bacterium]|nr:ankyrin repeat domain-containing protein [Planctomycetaceae bacterium]